MISVLDENHHREAVLSRFICQSVEPCEKEIEILFLMFHEAMLPLLRRKCLKWQQNPMG